MRTCEVHHASGFGSRGNTIVEGPTDRNGRARTGPPDPSNLGDLSEMDVMNVHGIVKKQFNIDTKRTYVVGQSMGGGGRTSGPQRSLPTPP